MSARILVTEDDQVQRDVICDILLHEGYDVIPSASGAASLSVLESDSCHLLLTDMRMPEMDGLELLRQAKRLRPGAPPRRNPLLVVPWPGGCEKSAWA